MARLFALLCVLLGFVLATRLAVGAISSRPGHDTVYTVAQVQAGLAWRPGAWAGRTVRVRGRATACAIKLAHGHFHCMPRQPRLNDPDVAATTEPLPLAWEDPSPALTVMRRVPLLGSLLPAPQTVDWWMVATYRVQLRATPDAPCGATTCYEAVLLDAVP
jgi:hypothetical protein